VSKDSNLTYQSVKPLQFKGLKWRKKKKSI